MVVHRSKPWQHGTPSLHRYRLAGWRRWLLWLLFGPVLAAGLVLVAGEGTDTRVLGLVLLAVGGLVLACWEWLWRYTMLELSPAGIRVRQLGYTLQAPWADVAGFSAVPMREGFVLARPMDGAGAHRLAGMRHLGSFAMEMYDGRQVNLLAERRLIPIDAFARHLRHGSLCADVVALAPHLAAQMAAQMAAVSAT